ncbi:MAG TPA: YihY/virulence factor BrkB family protein [Bacillales bacterium]
MAQQSVSVKRYIKEFYRRVMDDGVFDLSAQLAYYFLLSLFPLLIFAFALMSYIDLSVDQVLDMIRRYAPPEAFDVLKETLKSVAGKQHGGLLSVGVLATVWTASNAINAMIRALNRAYNVEESRPFYISRGLSILLTLAMIVVIIIALILPVFGELIGDFIFSRLGIDSDLRVAFVVLRWLFSFVVIVAVISGLYYFAPNKKLRFKDVVTGAVTAAVGWQVISLGFSYYVSSFGHYEVTYGGIGGIIILMIWFYLTGAILIIGGEINAVNWYFENKRR